MLWSSLEWFHFDRDDVREEKIDWCDARWNVNLNPQFTMTTQSSRAAVFFLNVCRRGHKCLWKFLKKKRRKFNRNCRCHTANIFFFISLSIKEKCWKILKHFFSFNDKCDTCLDTLYMRLCVIKARWSACWAIKMFGSNIYLLCNWEGFSV